MSEKRRSSSVDVEQEEGIDKILEDLRAEADEQIQSRFFPKEGVGASRRDFSEFIHIPCDNCHKLNATFICSQCTFAQYCNKECQREHWKLTHKTKCRGIFQQYNSEADKIRKLEAKADAYELQLCYNCSNRTQSDELLHLACGHIFCITCISPTGEETPFNCPICNEPLNRMLMETMIQDIVDTIAEADYHSGYYNNSSNDKFGFWVRFAREEWSRLHKFASRNSFLLGLAMPELSILNLHILNFEGKSERVIELSRSDANMFYAHRQTHMQLELFYCLGVALESMGEYQSARNTFRKCWKAVNQGEDADVYPHTFRLITNHTCQIGFLTGDEALAFGSAMMAVRYHNSGYGVLEMMSDYYRNQMKDWNNAIQCLRAAVRYECPWRPKYKERLKNKLQKLIQEKEQDGTIVKL
jgi:tetratricopeptide (TPR) repeat protein